MNTTLVLVSLLLFSSAQLAQIKHNRYYDDYDDYDSIVKGITSFLDEFDKEIASMHKDEHDNDVFKDIYGEIGNQTSTSLDLSLVPIPDFEDDEEAEQDRYFIPAEPDTPNSPVVHEIDVSQMTFDPAYPRFKSTSNTSTFLYHNLKLSPNYIDHVRNFSKKLC